MTVVTSSHERAGSTVKAHYRNGVRIKRHERSGAFVHEYERSGSSPGWRLRGTGSAITHPTSCWWCGERVFFYRNENGGCALFDSLGKPWPIHACWLDRPRRDNIEERVRSELVGRGFDGAFGRPVGKRITQPTNARRTLSLVGYIANNGALRDKRRIVRLKSNRRASTVDLARVLVWNDDLLFPFLMPLAAARELPDYMPVEIHGKWIERGERWRLMTTMFRPLRGKGSGHEKHLAAQVGACSTCGRNLGNRWGIADDTELECSDCGEMRGGRERTAFLKQAARIADHRRR